MESLNKRLRTYLSGFLPAKEVPVRADGCESIVEEWRMEQIGAAAGADMNEAMKLTDPVHAGLHNQALRG